MISYYRQSLVRLFSTVQLIREAPYSHIEECFEVQESLIRRITYIEQRLRETKSAIGTHRRLLKAASKDLQLSNFSLIENRRTQRFELFLTRIGERALMRGPDRDVYPCKEFWTADCYKYTLSFR